MFHYRNSGSSIGNVLCGLNALKRYVYISYFLDKLEFQYYDETNNNAYKIFC